MAEEKSYQQMRKEFQDKFFNKLSPALEKYDGQRKLKLAFAIVGASIFAILGILFGVFVFIADSSDAREGALKGSAFMFCIAWLIWYSIKKSFENKIKEKIMPDVCRCFNNLIWDQGKYSEGAVFGYSNLIPQFSSEEYDDIFYGKHRDVNFEIVESEFDIGSGKNRRTVFNGVIVKLDMNKNFKGKTVIRPDSVFHTTPSAALRHTTLEDVVFEKKFDVYTDDEVEARYLITPSFMERLNNMKVAFDADKVSCAFYEQYLFVALHTSKDLFSLCSLIKPVNDGKQFFQMFEEILSIIKLIDHFKLDQKIGL